MATKEIFISYTWRDGIPYVERLEKDLTAAGYKTWRDKRNLDEYQDFSAEIEMAIRKADYVVTCITPAVENSPKSFVRREINYAEAKDKPIIPLIFPNATPITLINHLTYISFSENGELAYERGFQQLVERLEKEPKPESRSHLNNPYRGYLIRFYDFIVDVLQHTVFSLIPLHGMSNPKGVRQQNLPRSWQATFDRARVNETAATPQLFFSFSAAYERYERQVLILGEPGAGKTTTLLAFARDAVAECLENPTEKPLPLWGNIATWDAYQQLSMATWLCQDTELDPRAIQKRINDGQVLLLLDGLDELGAVRPVDPERPTDEVFDPRKRFLQSLPSTCPLILTSRAMEYNEIGEKVALKGIFEILPLTEQQMEEYLKNMPDLWYILRSQPTLMSALRTPLLLSLVTFAFREARHQLHELASLSRGDLRDAIFARYLWERYRHDEVRYNVPMTLGYDEMIAVLGELAMWNAGSWRPYSPQRPESNILNYDDLAYVLGEDPQTIADFVSMMRRLSILIPMEERRFRFIHWFLRDHLAYTFALPRLVDLDWYRGSFHLSNPAITIGHLKDERAVPHLIAAFGAPDRDVRDSVVIALGDMGGPAVEPLLHILDSRHKIIRDTATEALVKIGEVAVMPLVAALKTTDNNYVKDCAVRALGQLQDRRAVPHVIQALHDADWEIRRKAATALGQIGDYTAVEPLVRALGDQDWNVRRLAAESLGKLRDPRAIEPLVVVLGDDNRFVRTRVAKALVDIGEAAIPSLIDALRDTDNDLRSNAAWALEKLNWKPEDPRHRLLFAIAQQNWEACIELGEAAVEFLIALLFENASDIRANVTGVLGRIGDRRAVQPLIALLSDGNYDIRARAATALGQIGDERALEGLILSLHDQAWQVRANAAAALGQLHNALAVQSLLNIAYDSDADVRTSVAEALGLIGDNRAMDMLLVMLRDKEPLVSASAAGALGRLGDLRVIPPLAEVLHHPHPFVRAMGAYALGYLKAASAVRDLIPLLQDDTPIVLAGDPTGEEVRDAAAWALDHIGTPQAKAALHAHTTTIHGE